MTSKSKCIWCPLVPGFPGARCVASPQGSAPSIFNNNESRCSGILVPPSLPVCLPHRVTPEGGASVTGSTPTAAWQELYKLSGPGSDGSRASAAATAARAASVSGPRLFGLAHPLVTTLIQALPGAASCDCYLAWQGTPPAPQPLVRDPCSWHAGLCSYRSMQSMRAENEGQFRCVFYTVPYECLIENMTAAAVLHPDQRSCFTHGVKG